MYVKIWPVFELWLWFKFCDPKWSQDSLIKIIKDPYDNWKVKLTSTSQSFYKMNLGMVQVDNLVNSR